MRRVPRLIWNRRDNVASLTVSFAQSLWHRREVGDDVILAYNATGRLARVVLLDPRSVLPPGAGVGEALEHVTALLIRQAQIRQEDLDVLSSALDRAKRT